MKGGELRPGDQFFDRGAFRYTLVAELPSAWPDEITFSITPAQAEGERTKTWRRNDDTPLTRPEAAP